MSDKELGQCTYMDNNCIIPEYIQHSHIVEFLVDNACYSLTSPRCDNIFEPKPITWKDIPASEAKRRLGINTDIEKILQAITSSSSDKELLDKIGEATYGFIKFIISTNKYISIEPYNVMSVLGLEQFRIKQYKMNYSRDIEEKFQDKKTLYLYHGSPYENWYSIMRSGIKNASDNKKLFLHGAVHGKGIYLSNDINYSMGYTGSTNGKHVLAIYEVIDNPAWKKTDNIYVIGDESALIIRYMIILTSCQLPTHITKQLNDKLNSGEQKQFEIQKEVAAAAVMSKAYSKRLMMEFKKIIKISPEELGFTLKLPVEDDLRVWQMFIHRVDNPKLEEQMTKLHIPHIEMEFTFPDGYPIDPPFIRIIYPHFQSWTGHITRGGSICMEAVSKSGWIPTTNVEALITQVRLILSDGGAQIDNSHYNKRYTMEEARKAFADAMAAHQW